MLSLRLSGSVLGRISLAFAVIGTLTTALHAQQLTPDQQATMLLASARKAFNEKNIPFAIERFKEFQAKFANNKEMPASRYGLALAYLELPEKNYQGTIEQLQPLAGVKDFPELPFVFYYLGLSQRGLGVRELAVAEAKPNEAPQRKVAANKHFDDALKNFNAAAAAFKTKVKPPPAEAQQLPADYEWYTRALCDEAEMLLRSNKIKESRTLVEPFVKDAVLLKSRYRGLALYYYGFTSFLLKDYLAAGRSLNQLTPFTDPIYGPHARYLLARTHHVNEERNEATKLYEEVLADYAKQKQLATVALQNQAQVNKDPEEKARLEALVKSVPDYVIRATFSLGVLQYEDGKFADALARFGAFPKEYPTSPLLHEAQLRQGFCQVQLKQFADAPKTLQPVVDKEPRLADQAMFWIGKAQVGAADPMNAQTYVPALTTAIASFRNAADRAQQQVASDPDAKTRRGEILLELADTQQLAKQFKEAAATYVQIVNEKLLEPRVEELQQRQITALHLAGDYAGSDAACLQFEKNHPKSTLMAAVLFRHAENAYFLAQVAEKNPNLPNRAQELTRLYDEVLKRYVVLVDKYPEFAHVNLARFGLAMALYHKGDLEQAKAAIEHIPPTERHGELALASYLLADCLIRLAPTKTDDALAAARLEEELKKATELLDSFLSANATRPEAGDALLKIGLCQQRLALVRADKKERDQILASARAAYERLLQQFPKHASAAQAVFERAKCLAQTGDVNGACNELKRFNADPLKATPVAPMAILHLATLLRGQNKSGDAADELAKCRPVHEPNLLKDPTRADWVPLLQYHHAIALKEAGKFPESRVVLQALVAQFPARPEAPEAALRLGQCFYDEGIFKIDAAHKKLATPNLKPEELTAANAQLSEGLTLVRTAVQQLETQAEQLKAKMPPVEARARMLYDAAWANRYIAEPEVVAARKLVVDAEKKKWLDEALKKTPGAKPPAVIPEPIVTAAQVLLQPSEVKARADYQALITAFPDLPLAVDARFELAELMADRAEFDPAVKLLKEALDKEPSAELADKIRIRLGACLFSKGESKEALAQLDAVANNVKSPLAGQAHYRAGECLLHQNDWAKAAARLAIFRDQGPYQNLLGLTDKALLRLGHAYANNKQWDLSRQAHELVMSRFPSSVWRDEARYGAGWAYQNLKQYDQAVNVYGQITAATAAEIAAKAQLQIGLCRLEQKRYPDAVSALLIVPFTYDFADLSAVALCEAARACTELKQPEQARKLFERVIKDHPDSKWAEVAKERLAALNRS